MGVVAPEPSLVFNYVLVPSANFYPPTFRAENNIFFLASSFKALKRFWTEVSSIATLLIDKFGFDG